MCIVLSGTFMTDLREDCARTLCYLAHSKDTRQEMVEAKAICGLVVLCAGSQGSIMIERFSALSLQRFSWSKEAHRPLLVDGGVGTIVNLMHRACDGYDPETFGLIICDCMTALANLSSSVDILEGLLQAQVVEALTRVAEKESIRDDVEAVWRVSYTLFHLSQTAAHRRDLGARGITRPLVDLLQYGNDASKQCCAAALCNLSKERSIQEKMVLQGALPVLITLSESENRITKQWCAIAIANLSAYSKLAGGTVAALLRMSAEEEKNTERIRNRPKLSEDGMQHVKVGSKHLKSFVHMGSGGHAYDDAQMEMQTDGKPSDRTTNRLVTASILEGQLISMPPAVQTHLGSDDEHREYSTRIIHQLSQPHAAKNVKAAAGLASSEMKPPKPSKMKKVRFGDIDEAAASSQDAPAYSGDDAIMLMFPKIHRIPNLAPVRLEKKERATKVAAPPNAKKKAKPRISSILVAEPSKQRPRPSHT